MVRGPNPPVTRRTRLRRETGPAHQILDNLLEQTGMMSTLSGYCAYLKASHHARALVEERLDANCVADIYRGLAAAPDPTEHRGRFAGFIDAYPAATPDAAASLHEQRARSWCALYVLEGSALGARVIASRIVDLGVNAEFGGRHLSQQIADGRSWGAYLDILEHARLNAEEENDCVSEALATFDCFIHQYMVAA